MVICRIKIWWQYGVLQTIVIVVIIWHRLWRWSQTPHLNSRSSRQCRNQWRACTLRVCFHISYDLAYKIQIIWHNWTSFIKGLIIEECPGMQDHLILYEVETIRDSFPWAGNHLFDGFLRQIRQVVYCFHWISGEGHTKWGCKFVWFYQLIFEVMSFDHGKLFDRFLSHSKLKGCSDRFHFEEIWSKMIPNSPHWLGNGLTNGFLRLFNLEQNLISLIVSDFEVHEFDIVDVGWEWAQILFGWLRQWEYIFLCGVILLIH